MAGKTIVMGHPELVSNARRCDGSLQVELGTAGRRLFEPQQNLYFSPLLQGHGA